MRLRAGLPVRTPHAARRVRGAGGRSRGRDAWREGLRAWTRRAGSWRPVSYTHLRLLFDEETWDAEAADFHSTVSRVRAMLATLASYADEVEAPPAGEGFLAWFLEDAREGNSAYFSTAAVAALRAQGIPARYVEGYRIGEDELARLAASGENRLVLTDADAHAWAEAYRDGIGWVPVDASPGFYEQPYAADEVVEVNQGMAGGDVADADPAGSVGGERGAEDAASYTHLDVYKRQSWACWSWRARTAASPTSWRATWTRRPASGSSSCRWSTTSWT